MQLVQKDVDNGLCDLVRDDDAEEIARRTVSWLCRYSLRSATPVAPSISGLLIVLSERTRSTTADKNRFSDNSDSSLSGTFLRWSLYVRQQTAGSSESVIATHSVSSTFSISLSSVRLDVMPDNSVLLVNKISRTSDSVDLRSLVSFCADPRLARTLLYAETEVSKA